MHRPGHRVHRLPRRTDYKLIPAPLDLSLPLLTEKSPLPTIIVTPSTPSSTYDFSIAFFASPPKPSIFERISFPSYSASGMRYRSVLFVLIVFFILLFHVITHTMANRPHLLELTVQTGVTGSPVSWFDRHSFFGGETPASAELENVNGDFAFPILKG